MCGRFVVARTIGELVTIFEVDEVVGEMPGISYNVAPTQQIAILVDRSFEKDEVGAPIGELSREFHSARWGLVPRWAKGANEGAPLINGRIETVLENLVLKNRWFAVAA
jgi:putative SOS response-associated peptidase YedK